MAKLVTVLGATGAQGGSVVRALLSDKSCKIRAVTRSRKSEKAQALAAQGVEVVEADVHDPTSLQAAFVGSHAIYAITNFFEAFPAVGKDKAIDVEVQMGTNIADAAAAVPDLHHFIWSTLPNSKRNSNGKVVVPHYEGKNRVEDYIKSLPELVAKTTFLLVPWYAQNIFYPFYQPFAIPTADPDTLYQVQATGASVPWKVAGDISVNLGLFVRAILEQPDKTLPGKYVLAALDDMTPEEIVSAWAAPQGKKGKMLQISREQYYSMWPMWAEVMDLSQQYLELMGEKSYLGEHSLVTREDLGLEGLVGTAEFFARVQQ
ncbi:hypothetical protein LTR53_015451 [Teratosphaeriaceae sp. CCFEE 6253]|nr:hypothetical protein LTR53_015451 [Teratosphaeriaceae sp. CCFEE 6253]